MFNPVKKIAIRQISRYFNKTNKYNSKLTSGKLLKIIVFVMSLEMPRFDDCRRPVFSVTTVITESSVYRYFQLPPVPSPKA